LFTVGALTAGLTWTIGNVQLEKGSTATSFDYRPYGTELALCQRYYQFVGGTASGFPMFQGYSGAAVNFRQPISFPVAMRSAPTATKLGTWNVNNCGQPSADFISANGFSFLIAVSGSGAFDCYPNTTDDLITFSSEL
jgi:hypothetical protein